MMSSGDELTTVREHLERYRRVTLQTLDLVSDEKLAWRPAAALRSFAEQFLHIAQTEDFYAHGLLMGDWSLERFQAPSHAMTRERLIEQLAGTRAFTLDRLSRVEPEQLGEGMTVPGIPVTWPLRSWLWYLVEHEVHHKAQLAFHLRQIGVTPPFFAYALPPGVRPDARPEV
jgi:uncharacterized damage-inducible protein DinB